MNKKKSRSSDPLLSSTPSKFKKRSFIIKVIIAKIVAIITKIISILNFFSNLCINLFEILLSSWIDPLNSFFNLDLCNIKYKKIQIEIVAQTIFNQCMIKSPSLYKSVISITFPSPIWVYSFLNSLSLIRISFECSLIRRIS